MRNERRLALVLVLATAAGCAQRAPASSSDNGAPAVPLVTVRAGALPVVLTENGSVGSPAASSAQLAFVTSGTIAGIDVRVGDRVSAGEPLATLDARSFALAAASAKADARAAAATEQSAAVDRYGARVAADFAAYDRAQRLYQAGVVAQKDVQDARATLAQDQAEASAAHSERGAARAQAQSAQAKALAADTDLARTTLRSPIDGVVSAVLHRSGESVDPTTAVIVIAPPAQHEITLRVPASDATQIAVGDPASIIVNGSQNSSGRVTAVVNALDPSTQAATVVIDGVPPGAPAGAPVQAQITVARARGLVVPEAAIVTDPQGGDNDVFVRERQKDGSYAFTPRAVTISHENARDALVTSGVRTGDRIAARGAFELLAPAGGGD